MKTLFLYKQLRRFPSCFRPFLCNYLSNKRIVVNFFHSSIYHSCKSTSLKLTKTKMSSQFIYPINTPIALLDCTESFNSLSEKEKLYAHYLSRASWFGGLIDLPQTSLESPLIFVLLHKLFSMQPIQALKEIALKEYDFNEDEFKAFIIYSCGLMFSMGNFKSMGSKFVPDLPKEKFEKLVLASSFAKNYPERVTFLLSSCFKKIYSLDDCDIQLNFPDIGTTTYFSKNFCEEDKEIVKNFYEKHNLEAYNTRVFKTVNDSGKICYEIRLASALQTGDSEEKSLLFSNDCDSHMFIITRGDYSELLKRVNEYLMQAKMYAANATEEQMIEKYIQSFRTGSIDAHKEGSILWVKDKGPIVESYIGFIETYRDPAGMRGEFEGFVSVVNKKQSEKFSKLVDGAPHFLSLLPWPSTYEKDKFLLPDFTSLDILTYANSDIPVGINIPNYVDIKQSVGFKNVSLGNVISTSGKEPPNYLIKSDQDLFVEHYPSALELQVGLHELLGHGSGKLFQRESNGDFNFDINSVLHLDTNEKVKSWYNFGESYDSVFGSLSNPYEECKAECVGLYLCTVPEILEIFVPDQSLREDIMYVNWVMVVIAGLGSLIMYEPKTETWLQAHSQAAYVILQVLLEAGGDFVKVEQITASDGKPDLLFTLDRGKIMSVGRPCIGNFLKKLQLYKSTADVSTAKAMFEKYSVVTSEGSNPFLKYREIVLERRKPRRLCVQANTVVEDEKVKLINYEASPEGMIQSWLDRFKNENVDDILVDIWQKDRHHFS
nr:dipeptidyl peptidase 3 isoform X2 [Parasteatoda tepidariorum]